MRHATSHSIFPPHITRSRSHAGRFGRLFGQGFTVWEPPGKDDAAKEKAIRDFAVEKMFVDGADDNDEQNDQKSDGIPVGYTYFGQFIDHDITFDPQSSLTRKNDPNGLQNSRSPRFDLDSVYGGGPDDQPFLYDKAREDDEGFSGFLKTSFGEDVPSPDAGAPSTASKEFDLQRNGEGTAIIGDPRNDENVIVSQLQLAFCFLHNNILELLVEAAGTPQSQHEGKKQRELFDEAQRLTTWFYQYVVWNDFVERIVDPKIFASAMVLPAPGALPAKVEYGLKHVYDWTVNPYIPVEFSVAAYRFGHSMIRGGYLLNVLQGFDRTNRDEFLPIFDPQKTKDLRGGHKLRVRHSIQWDWYFRFASSRASFQQIARRIDTRLSKAVFAIPGGAATHPLAELNIRRGWRMQLPPATEVARALNVTPQHIDDPMEQSLWVYILKEAETLNEGKFLGPVGSTIVAAVFSGLLRGDAFSYVSRDPAWTPDSELLDGEGLFTRLLKSVGTRTGKTDGRLGKASDEREGNADPRRWEMADIIRASGLPEDFPDIQRTVPAKPATPPDQQQPAPVAEPVPVAAP